MGEAMTKTTALAQADQINTHLAVQSDRIVASMHAALVLLKQAKTIGEVKQIIDMAAAAEVFSMRQHLGKETEALAAAVRAQATRELGAVLLVTEKARGTAGAGDANVGRVTGGRHQRPPVNDAPTYADLGLSKDLASFAQKLAGLSEDEYQKVREGELSAKQAVAAAAAKKKADDAQAAAEQRPPAAEQAPATVAKPLTPAQQKKADQAEKQAEAERQREEAYGDFDAIKELEAARAEIEAMQKVIAAAEADDKKAEVMKWRRAYDAAVRGQSMAMDRAHQSVEREKWLKRALMRCGKAVGCDDEFKIVAAVEAMARAAKGVA